MEETEITACIKTFLRPECCERLIKSIQKYYPNIQITVLDDSPTPKDWTEQSVNQLSCQSNIGVSAGRNRLIESVVTKYGLMLDDDFVFTNDTRLQDLVTVVENSEVVLAYGTCDGIRHPLFACNLIRKGDTLYLDPNLVSRETCGVQWKECHQAPNVFLFPKGFHNQFAYNESCKTSGEHVDGAIRMKEADIKLAFVPSCSVDHERQDNSEYHKHRRKGKSYLDKILHTHGLKTSEHLIHLPVDNMPDIVVITTGGTGSSHLVEMWKYMGWKVPDEDEFFEVASLRELIIANEDLETFRAEIAKWPRPWIVKDPRLADTTLGSARALQALSEYNPLLIWSRRESVASIASINRRWSNIDADNLILQRNDTCIELFETWKGFKKQVWYGNMEVISEAWKKVDLRVSKHSTDSDPNYDDRKETSSPMQFVWVYWDNGSQNDELRWSMRSVLQNFKGEPELLIVGDRPKWYSGNYIPVKRCDPCRLRSYRDVLNKIHFACTSEIVNEKFVWMMDDTYFVNPVTETDLSVHRFHGTQHKRPVRKSKIGNTWEELKRVTFLELEKRRMPTRDWCTHLPHIIESQKWLEMWNRFNLSTQMLQWELLYGNSYFKSKKSYKGFLRRIQSVDRAKRLAGGTKCKIMNNNEKGWCEQTRAFLWNEFPTKAIHERVDAKPPLWKLAAPIVRTRYNFEIKDDYQDRGMCNHNILSSDHAQRNVYEFAKSVCENPESVFDIGCGNGFKLIDLFGTSKTIGLDVEKQIARCRERFSDRQWEVAPYLADKAELVLCVDVIEHLDNPLLLLEMIHSIDFRHCVISTPERDICRGKDHKGPPLNVHHCREWNQSEFVCFIRKHLGKIKTSVVLGKHNLVVHIERTS